MKVGITERQAPVLAMIEDEIAAGRPSPNTVELAKATGYGTGEIARILDALQVMATSPAFMAEGAISVCARPRS
jgi:hypothetical protein